MGDVKDILGVKKVAPAGVAKPAQPKPAKGRLKKLEGVSREVYMLMNDNKSDAIMPGVQLEGLKEKRKVSAPAAKWAWRSFHNSARKDGLQLKHWEKLGKADKDPGYSFAKFNKPVKIVQYTDQEYTKHCQSDEWSREETDYLWSLCRSFHLVFPVVADRYSFKGKTRPVEELKGRYYSVARSVMLARAPHIDHPLVNVQYNQQYDTERRQYVDQLFHRTREEEEADARRQREEEEATKTKGGRHARESAILEVALQGKVKDPAAMLALLSESLIPSKGAHKRKRTPETPSLHPPLRATSLRRRVMGEAFEGAKAKKIEPVAQEFGVEFWAPRVCTEPVQSAYEALQVEMLLVARLNTMLATRNDAVLALTAKRDRAVGADQEKSDGA